MTGEASSFELYRRRLSKEPLEIRLLRISHSSYTTRDDPIHCSLDTFVFLEAPKYRCVSYCWGKQELNAISITIDGRVGTLNVTKNLFRCLQQLREAIRDGTQADSYVWADAVCINQNDDLEKLAQIKYMGGIYSGAQEVVAWLGLESDRRGDGSDDAFDAEGNDEGEHLSLLPPPIASHSAEDAMQAVAELGAAMRTWSATHDPWTELSHYAFKDKRCYEALGFRQFPLRTWYAIAIFLGREWWSRAWISPEVTLAQRLRFICGQHQFDYDDLLYVCIFLHGSGWHIHLLGYAATHGFVGAIGEQCLYLAAMRKLARPSLGTSIAVFGPAMDKNIQAVFDDDAEALVLLVTRVQVFKTTDARDKALVPLTLYRYSKKHAEHTNLPIEYASDVSSLYTQLSAYLLRTSNSLVLLSQVEDASMRQQPGLPSWCPDYTVSAYHPPLGDILLTGYDALRSRQKYCSIDMDTRTLTLDGLFLEEIGAIHPSLFSGSTAKSLIEICLTLPPSTEVLWRTIIADRLSGTSPALAVAASYFKGWLQYLIAGGIFGYNFKSSLEPKEDWSEWSCFDEVHDSSSAASQVVPSVAELSSYVERYRELLVAGESSLPEMRQLQAAQDVLASGLLGLAPPSSRQGDQVWFFSGAKLPFVLQPEADGVHYTLVGEAYVNGFMRGEILDVMAESDFKKVMIR
ncbi:hypothetical protein LTS10_007875 [Elasticomyces elasticus]|nr:hypothetical protein LTS10_007875 [Elasticomyces elasticus]